MAKSLAVEATVFWLVVSAIIIFGSSISADIILLSSSVVTALVYLIVAYVCWSLRRWGFAAAIILALFTILGSITFTFFENPTPITSGFEVLYGTGFLIVPQLILIFYSLRAYREHQAP